MKKRMVLAEIIALTMCFTSVSFASDGHKHGHHKHHKYDRYHEDYYYQPSPYYAPPPPPVRYDRRSHQGLAGGVVGSVLGYELGNGHPLATGIGAAAGSLLGNGIPGGR